MAGMAGKGWKWLERAGMTGNGWKRLEGMEMAAKWLEIAGNG